MCLTSSHQHQGLFLSKIKMFTFFFFFFLSESVERDNKTDWWCEMIKGGYKENDEISRKKSLGFYETLKNREQNHLSCFLTSCCNSTFRCDVICHDEIKSGYLEESRYCVEDETICMCDMMSVKVFRSPEEKITDIFLQINWFHLTVLVGFANVCLPLWVILLLLSQRFWMCLNKPHVQLSPFISCLLLLVDPLHPSCTQIHQPPGRRPVITHNPSSARTLFAFFQHHAHLFLVVFITFSLSPHFLLITWQEGLSSLICTDMTRPPELIP